MKNINYVGTPIIFLSMTLFKTVLHKNIANVCQTTISARNRVSDIVGNKLFDLERRA